MSIAGAILARPEVLSFWRLDEASSPHSDDVGAIDATETAFGGGITQGQTSIVPDTSENSILFPDIGGDGLTLTNAYDFTGTTTFTAYCWLKPTTFDAINGNYIWGNQDGAARGWSLAINSPASVFQWQMRRGDAAGFDLVLYTATTEAEYENGIPKQVAMSYDGTDLILNIDGVDVAQGASSKSLVAPTTNTILNFGRYGGGGSGYEGYAQYLAIFSPNLVEADLLDIFNGGSEGVEEGYRRFVGPVQLGTSAADLYTVPDGARITIRNLYVNNPSGSEVEFTLSVGNDAAGTRLLDQHAVPANDSYASRRATHHALEAGEKIQGFADAATTVVVIDGYVEAL